MSAPLSPADLDLRDFPFVPVDVRRLLTSETWLTATGDEKAAAMTLWLESWHQVPAGSLPDNDRMLSILSQAGGKWAKVKRAALRGWIKCDDGRLYHPVVCEKAAEAWAKKQAQRQRTEAACLARLNRAATHDETEPVISSVTENVTGSKGQGQGQGSNSAPNGAAPADHEVDLFRRGKAVLGKDTGGLIRNLLKAKDGNVALARAAIETASTKENPREYIGAIVRNKDPPDSIGVVKVGL